MFSKSTILLLLVTLLMVASCREIDQYLDEVEPKKLQAKEFASGLLAPIGIAIDPKGHIWVAEAGTGKNDGRVSIITPQGKVYPAITGFTSIISSEETPDGLNHLVYKDGLLYILHGVDEKLYLADVSSFTPGDKPLSVSELDSEAIGKFVLDYQFEEDAEDSNLYNLTFGPDGALYIVDAGANAIIRRAPSGKLSVFATFPNFKNPTPIGPPSINSVPTGIVYNGEKFLVTTLTGFPFPAGKASIYEVNLYGEVSLFQSGFSTLVDLTLGTDNRPLVLQVAQFGEQGFAPNTGKIIRSTSKQNTVLLEGLNFPTDIERSGLNSYYVASLAEGKILKVD
jgi:hypothetical protein